MTRGGISFSIAVFSVLACCHAASGAQRSSGKLPQKYELWDFEEDACRAKGRLQDCTSRIMDQILRDGKDAIPVLISQFRETRATPRPVLDYWSLTTSGDVAYFILSDLFTDADWKTFTMPGLEPPYLKNCHSYAEDCWRTFLRKHGRKFVQDQWQAAWKKNKERIYWDETAHCFRLSAQPQPNASPEKH